MKYSIAAPISIMMLILIGLAPAPQPLASGADPEDHGKTYLVKNSEGEYLGTARKVLVNPLDQADFVVVSLEQGKYGTKEIIVPFSAISFADENSIILDLGKEVLAEAPVFSRPELTDPEFFEGVYRFYGMAPPWTDGKGEGQEER